MTKILNLSLGNGLSASVKGTEESLLGIIESIEKANREGDFFLDVEFRGAPGKISAQAVIGFNIVDTTLELTLQ